MSSLHRCLCPRTHPRRSNTNELAGGSPRLPTASASRCLGHVQCLVAPFYEFPPPAPADNQDQDHARRSISASYVASAGSPGDSPPRLIKRLVYNPGDSFTSTAGKVMRSDEAIWGCATAVFAWSSASHACRKTLASHRAPNDRSGSWPCQNSDACRGRRNISAKLIIMKANHLRRFGSIP